jgi:16S rRNA G527 N7-methylase RsmG
MIDLTSRNELLKLEISPHRKLELILKEGLLSPNEGESIYEHSSFLDDFLGIDSLRIETALAREKTRETKTWVGLDPQTLQTPFCEIFSFLNFLKQFNPQHIVDLGAGYGRVGIIMKMIMEDSHFSGYEFIESRFDEMCRVFETYEITNATLSNKNIMDVNFHFPKADVYFIYDFSDLASIKKMVAKFTEIFNQENLFLVVRGKAMRSLIQNQYRELWALNGAIHTENWSIYSSFVDLEEKCL